MNIYLDNCCYNRPYDDQAMLSVALEAKCKLHIQELIRQNKYTLVGSYMLRYECSQNPYTMRKEAIMDFLQDNVGIYVGNERKAEIEKRAREIMQSGIKFKDACHVASAIYAGCEYFISTDKRLLKFKTNEIRMVTPIEFVAETEEE
mgnify:CR=1 FL=1